MRTVYVLIWRDGPEDGKERYMLTPQQRGAPAEPGKWVLLGEAMLSENILAAAFDAVSSRQQVEAFREQIRSQASRRVHLPSQKCPCCSAWYEGAKGEPHGDR